MRTVVQGLGFGESVRWHGGALWVCDWRAGDVVRVSAAGEMMRVLRMDAFPLCIDWLPDGRLLVVDGTNGRVLRQERGGELVMHADLRGLGQGRWNEIAVADSGVAYVNGGPGLIAAVDPDGGTHEVADGLAWPNGMLVTPDGGTLIVAESNGRRLTAFDIAAGGTLTGRRVWADLGDSNPDGICLDAEGAVWYADVPHRCCRRVREGGEVLDTVDSDRGCFSCALGGGNQPELFVAATEWRGMQHAFDGPATGLVFAVAAPAGPA